jgi:hypothetical protein
VKVGINRQYEKKDFAELNLNHAIKERRQPAGTTVDKRSHFRPRKIHHVDVPAGL